MAGCRCIQEEGSGVRLEVDLLAIIELLLGDGGIKRGKRRLYARYSFDVSSTFIKCRLHQPYLSD